MLLGVYIISYQTEARDSDTPGKKVPSAGFEAFDILYHLRLCCQTYTESMTDWIKAEVEQLGSFAHDENAGTGNEAVEASRK